METLMPEDLTKISPEELAALGAALNAEFDALHDAGDHDADAVAVLTQIADAIDKVNAETATRTEAAEVLAAQVAELAARVHPATSDPANAETDPPADGDPVTSDPVIASGEVPKPAPKAPSAKATKAKAITPEAPKAERLMSITAAGGVPNIPAGTDLKPLDLAKAFGERAYTLKNHSGRVSVAQVNTPFEFELGDDHSAVENIATIEKLTDINSLTAAGWCAPSNNMYELFGIEGTDGIIDLPTAKITRGGVNIPGFISIGDAEDADGLWTWTEGSGESSETKVCAFVPCPAFVDYRLEAEGLCLLNGNLMDKAYPELTQRFISVLYAAHLHRIGAAVVNKIVGTATGVTMDAVASSAAGSILNAIDVQVEDFRSQYRMPVKSILETDFPLWTKALIRADLAMMYGVELKAVSDAMIAEYFSVRYVRAQFLHGYQPMYSGATPKKAFPTTLKFLLYPAGGYFKGDGGVIDLGVIRDSVLNATNDYTAAWSEQMYLVGQVGPKARQVTVNYAVNGVTGCCV